MMDNPAIPVEPERPQPVPDSIIGPSLPLCNEDKELPPPRLVLPERAEFLHGVNHKLLRPLDIGNEHFQFLREFGFSAEQIRKREYKTALPSVIRKAITELVAEHGIDELATVPGFRRIGEQLTFPTQGRLLVPVRELSGRILALECYDFSPEGELYFPQGSCGDLPAKGGVHVPLDTPIPSPVLRIVEGELHADLLTAECGMPALSVTRWETLLQAAMHLLMLGGKEIRLLLIGDSGPNRIRSLAYNLFCLTGFSFDIVIECWQKVVPAGDQTGARTELIKSVVHGREIAPFLDDLLRKANGEEVKERTVEAFPIDVLPPDLACFCQEVASATQTPADFAAVTLLVTAGAAIGANRAICLKEGSWYEPPSVYAVIVGSVASGKTPAMDLVLEPYQSRQIAVLKAYVEAKEAYDAAMAKAGSGGSLRRGHALGVGNPGGTVLEPPEEPERFVVMNSTVEALAPMLAKNPQGLLSVHDEAAAWVRGLNQYKGGRGTDRQFFLSVWSGKAHIVDRKSDPCPIAIGRPFLSVIGGIQPDMLSELVDSRGRDDGFLDRILFAFPESTGAASWTDSVVSAEARETWAKTLDGLRGLPMHNEVISK